MDWRAHCTKSGKTIPVVAAIPSCLGSLYSRAGANEERKNMHRQRKLETNEQKARSSEKTLLYWLPVYSIVRRVTLRESKL